MAITKTFKKTETSTMIEEFISDEDILAQNVYEEKSVGNTSAENNPRRQIETGLTLTPIVHVQDATAVSANNSKSGKTWADVFSEQINNSRVIFLFLYITSFALFMMTDRTYTLKSLFEIPLWLGTFFNLVWFIIWPVLNKMGSIIFSSSLKSSLIQ